MFHLEILDIEKLKNSLKRILNEIAKPLDVIDFSRENYNKLFPESRIQTSLFKNVKLDKHQFKKLDVKERQNILQAVYETLKIPDVVIQLNGAFLYGKAFKINGKNKVVQSVIYGLPLELSGLREDENPSIKPYKRDINNVVNKIKMPEQLIYVSEEIGQMIERLTDKQLFTTVNSTRVSNIASPFPNISQSTQKSSAEFVRNQLKAKQKLLRRKNNSWSR